MSLIYTQSLYLNVPFSLYRLFNNSFSSYYALFNDFINEFFFMSIEYLFIFNFEDN